MLLALIVLSLILLAFSVRNMFVQKKPLLFDGFSQMLSMFFYGNILGEMHKHSGNMRDTLW